MGITGMKILVYNDIAQGLPQKKNGKKWEEYKNWVKILSDSYKRAILVRKNGEKWGNIEMKIESNFEPRLNCSRMVHFTLLIATKEDINEWIV